MGMSNANNFWLIRYRRYDLEMVSKKLANWNISSFLSKTTGIAFFFPPLTMMFMSKFYAFDMPVEVLSKFPEPFLSYWKDTRSVFYGCNEAVSEVLKIEAKELVGETDCLYTTKEKAGLIAINDQQILDRQSTNLFLETICLGNGAVIKEVSIKTHLRTSAN